MDFVHDQLFDGRPFRMLTLIDQFSQLSPKVEPWFSFSGCDVVAAPGRLIQHTGIPVSIAVDHGMEFTSKAIEKWAYRVGVKLGFTHPGKPAQNGHIESFNGRLRDECLNVDQFMSLKDAQKQIYARRDYNHHQPHSSLGHLTRGEFASRSPQQQTAEAAKL
jgi:putative transposase